MKRLRELCAVGRTRLGSIGSRRLLPLLPDVDTKPLSNPPRQGLLINRSTINRPGRARQRNR
jgi:hypothetical protein